MPRRRYPTDLTDAQWAIFKPYVPPPTAGGLLPKHSQRELVDAMLYILRSGSMAAPAPRVLVVANR